MIDFLNLTGKTYLLTGASSGIGRATAILLSKLGAKVVLVARDRNKLEHTASLMMGKQHIIEVFDLCENELINEWMKKICENTGTLDGLIHCAGVRFSLPLKTTDVCAMKVTFETNVNSSFFLVQAFAKNWAHKTNSSIVLISSVLGLVGEPGGAAYAASKGAIISLTKAFAVELARNKIRVNCIAPGVVKTEMVEKCVEKLTPEQLKKIESRYLLGFGEPEDVANSIVFLLSDAARWITGSILTVDGGYTAA